MNNLRYDPSIAKHLIDSAYDDQRYAELLDRCAEITKERDVARARGRFFVDERNRWQRYSGVLERQIPIVEAALMRAEGRANRWYRKWIWTMGALCAVVACWVIWEVGRWI